MPHEWEHLADYLATIVLGQHLLRLVQAQQRSFAEAVTDTLLRRVGPPLIDYVRLNIVARKGN